MFSGRDRERSSKYSFTAGKMTHHAQPMVSSTRILSVEETLTYTCAISGDLLSLVGRARTGRRGCLHCTLAVVRADYGAGKSVPDQLVSVYAIKLSL